MHALLLLGLLLQEGVVTSSEEGPDIRVSGALDLHYVHTDGGLEETRNSLNGTPAPADDATFFAGPVSLRLDLYWDRSLTSAIEIANRPINLGANVPFGTNPEGDNVYFTEAWLQARDFPLDKLTLRAGMQPFRFTNRYDDEPFFLDLSRSESAWTGLTPAGTVATADRDTIEPVGLRVWYDAAIFLKVQAFAFTLVEGGGPSLDESVFGLQASAKTSEVLTLKVLATLFSGPLHNSSVWTAGAAVAHSPHEDWLISVEAYAQAGKSRRRMEKSAWAANLSVRTAGTSWWGDVGFEYASGDDPGDPEDDGWQSYENVNRFAVVQSAEFGLDWDTNYLLARAAFEYRWEEVTKLRLDLGWFRILEEVPGVATADDRQLGVEVDVTIRQEINLSASVYLRTALLFGSEVMEAATADDDDDTWVVFLGADVKF